MGQRVLVVDDDPTVSDVVRRYLERADFEVILAGDGRTALAKFASESPDLVILDLMLPASDQPGDRGARTAHVGLEVCRQLRARPDGVPIVMLTALGEEADRVLGLQLGADDYVTKPFSPRELVLRVQSVLRRSRAAAPAASETVPSEVFVDGDLMVDAARRVATRGGSELALTVREFDLLLFLLRNPGRVVRRQELLKSVWGWTFGDQSTVTVHVRRLREKIEDDPANPKRIVTVWGVGYRYELASRHA